MRLVALGDSFTCGEGVGVRVPADATWTALTARSLGATHTSYAAPGARVRNVLHDQLPRVGTSDVATVLVGLNDVARGGFDPVTVRTDLLALVEGLQARAGVVLLGRLHDPTRMLPIPFPARELARRRVARLNAAVDEVLALTGAQLLDLEAVPAWQLRGAWDVDRVHPSAAGHAVLADAARDLLAGLGLTVDSRRAGVVPAGRSLAAQAIWFARHGAPYLAGRVRELGTPAWGAVTGSRLRASASWPPRLL